MKDMINKDVLEDTDGTIEKVSRKPKRIYDRDLLTVALKKHRLAGSDIEAIIEASTRQITVSQYLSVTPKHKKL